MKALPKLDSAEIVRLRPDVTRPPAGTTPLDLQIEIEPRDRSGAVAKVATLFLRGSECRFRCLMCDLWRFTHAGPTPPRAIVEQIQFAVGTLQAPSNSSQRQTGPLQQPPPRWIKLYNASNFFSPYNVPTEDLPAIAALLNGFERVVVENHPKLTNAALFDFAAGVSGRLEVAMGLETVHPDTLRLLNKSMQLHDFSDACMRLRQSEIDIRAFVLLKPPGMNEAEAIQWCLRSIRYAAECGARQVSIIPVRAGNGALEYLSDQSLFTPPLAASLETVMVAALQRFDVVTTADLWDWELMRGLCSSCSAARRQSLEQLNLTQDHSLLRIGEHSGNCRCPEFGFHSAEAS